MQISQKYIQGCNAYNHEALGCAFRWGVGVCKTGKFCRNKLQNWENREIMLIHQNTQRNTNRRTHTSTFTHKNSHMYTHTQTHMNIYVHTHIPTQI